MEMQRIPINPVLVGLPQNANFHNNIVYEVEFVGTRRIVVELGICMRMIVSWNPTQTEVVSAVVKS